MSHSQTTAQRVVMRPAWLHLLFMHWEVDAEVLRRQLPPGLELDLFDGRAFVGLVPFTMLNVRPHGLPHLPPLRRWHEDFHECNVRIYVKHPTAGPGVWFFSLDAASSPAVIAARAWFKLPYFRAQMALERRDGGIHYTSERRWPQPLPAACDISYQPHGALAPAAPGTLEHFLVERYVLFSQSRGRLFAGRVAHKPYQIQPATVSHCTENLIAAAGIPRPESPVSTLYSPGVRVDVFGLRAL